jgi:hypothetical protein
MTMKKRTQSTMTGSRFEVLVATYGADPARWPEHERIAAMAIADAGGAENGRYASALGDARALDHALDSDRPPAPSDDLRQRIEALAGSNVETEPAHPPARARSTPWTLVWRPALFASSGVLGALAGLALVSTLALDTGTDTFDLTIVAGGAIDPGFSGLIEE